MTINKKISPFCCPGEIILTYSNEEHTKSDSSIKIYTMQKISFLLTDDLAAVIGDNVYNTVRGDFFVFSPDEIHFGRFLRAGVHRYLDFYIPVDYFGRKELIDPAAISDADIQCLFRKKGESRGNHINFVHPDDEKRAEILRICEKLVDIAERHPEENDHSSDLLIFAMMIELLDVCAAAYLRQKANPVASSVPLCVTKTLRYINENFADQVELTELSKAAGCSVTYLTKTFRRHTGKTIHEYLTECRISAAERLLLGGATVTDACYGSGFGSCSSFIKVFRKYTGTTPGKYRVKVD